VVPVGLDTPRRFVGTMLASCDKLKDRFSIGDEFFDVHTDFVVHTKEFSVEIPSEEEVKPIVVPFGDVGSFPVLDYFAMQVLCFVTVHDDKIVAPPEGRDGIFAHEISVTGVIEDFDCAGSYDIFLVKVERWVWGFFTL